MRKVGDLNDYCLINYGFAVGSEIVLNNLDGVVDLNILLRNPTISSQSYLENFFPIWKFIFLTADRLNLANLSF